jgi:hypothetical protein
MVALMNPGKALAWYPWRTASQVLTSPGKVADIPVDEVWRAVSSLVAARGK